MSLEQFKHSAAGRKIADLLASEDAIHRMEDKSRNSRPAVEAIGKEIETRVGALDDESRKMVGRWVKEVLAPRGWRPDRKGRVASGHLFARGTIYRRAGERRPPADGLARFAAARAILAQMPGRPMSSDELIEQRRRSFGQGE
jgi:hypothetical protein